MDQMRMKQRIYTVRRWRWLLAVAAALLLYHGAGTAVRQETGRTQIVFPVPGEWADRKPVRKVRVGANKVRSWRSQVPVTDWQNAEEALGT